MQIIGCTIIQNKVLYCFLPNYFIQKFKYFVMFWRMAQTRLFLYEIVGKWSTIDYSCSLMNKIIENISPIVSVIWKYCNLSLQYNIWTNILPYSIETVLLIRSMDYVICTRATHKHTHMHVCYDKENHFNFF